MKTEKKNGKGMDNQKGKTRNKTEGNKPKLKNERKGRKNGRNRRIYRK
jgi:hypothetical protein